MNSRLATGNPDDPNSPHQTLGTLFKRSAINTDWAYVQFRYEDLWINGGKFPHPFKTPGVYFELVWDADVQPEGIAAGYTLKVGDNLNIFITGVEYILQEQGNDSDATLGAGQVALNLAQKPIAVTVAGGIYKYFKLDADDIGAASLAGIVAGDNAGNAVLDTDSDGNLEFESDFTVLDTFINLTYILSTG